jgi:YesN/AraC family two-component response regulator
MITALNLDQLPIITSFGYVSYKEPWIHFRRNTKDYSIYIIQDGELYIEENGLRYSLTKGDVIVLEPDMTHIGFKKACCDYYYIHFRYTTAENIHAKSLDEIVQEILDKRNKSLKSNPLGYFEYSNSVCYMPKHYNIKDKSVLSHIMFFLKDALEDYNKKYLHYRVVFASRLLQFCVTLSGEYLATEVENLQTSFSRAFLKVEAVQNYMLSNFRNSITRFDIQNEFNSNYDYMNRMFKRLTNHTIIDYLNRVRIDKSRELIENTSLSFSEISFEVGINDPYYFSKVFKKYTEMSPLEYRKKRRHS